MADEATEDERDIELSAIAAIFPELSIDPKDPHCAELDLEVAPANGLRVTFIIPPLPASAKPPTPPYSDDVEAQERPRPVVVEAEDTHILRYLPSFHLRITLPDGYPDHFPPNVTLKTNPQWLTPSILWKLEKQAAKLWQEYGHSQVVYAYIDFLLQEAETAFSLEDEQLKVSEDLKSTLLLFDKETAKRKFDDETFDCGICLEPKKGSVCYRLRDCRHVFCTSCLQDFYNGAITEGDVSSVKCLDPDCGSDRRGQGEGRRRKRQRTLRPSELLDIPLERSQAQRYVDLRLKKKFESDKSTIYCPRKFCQAPARSAKYAKYDSANIESYPESESDSETEDNAQPAADANAANQPVQALNQNVSTTKPPPDRLSICSKCSYAFCRICLRSWHGELLNCLPPSSKESQLSPDEQASYDYIRLHTSPCPTCESPCQKTRGCNHMRCFTCNTHFCYLCSAWLLPDNPYRHFNIEGSECYMKLWELEEGDEGQAHGGVFGGARAAEQAADFAAQFDVDEGNNGAAAPEAVRQVAPGNDNRGRVEDPVLQQFLDMANDDEDAWDSDEREMIEDFLH